MLPNQQWHQLHEWGFLRSSDPSYSNWPVTSSDTQWLASRSSHGSRLRQSLHRPALVQATLANPIDQSLTSLGQLEWLGSLERHHPHSSYYLIHHYYQVNESMLYTERKQTSPIPVKVAVYVDAPAVAVVWVHVLAPQSLLRKNACKNSTYLVNACCVWKIPTK